MSYIESLIELDTILFLWANQLSGNPVLDSIMLGFSSKWLWLPLYGFLVYYSYQEYIRGSLLWIVLAAAIMIVITDQGSVNLFKEVFQRLRPCHEDDFKNLINLVSGSCGGHFGFVSSHAANVFGIASFFSVILPQFGVKGLLLFGWAAIVSISRVYLGVHYPFDIIIGAVFGGIVGWSTAIVTMKSIVK